MSTHHDAREPVEHPTSAGTTHDEPSRWRVPAIQAAATVALFGLVGLGAGFAWWRLWAPAPPGVVVSGEWFPLPPVGSASQFEGTAWYVVAAAVAGLVTALVVGLVLDREEVVTLVAVLVGSVLAAWVAYRVGTALGPPDPAIAARTAEDGTRLDGALDVLGRSPFLAFPTGALLGLAISFFGVVKQPAAGGRTPARDQD